MTRDQYLLLGRIARIAAGVALLVVVGIGVAFSLGFYLSAVVRLLLAGWRLAWAL